MTDMDLWPPEPTVDATLPGGPEPICTGCNRHPDRIPIYAQMAQEEGITATAYVRREEGTLNPVNGHFLCDACYIRAGMPSGPHGWVAP